MTHGSTASPTSPASPARYVRNSDAQASSWELSLDELHCFERLLSELSARFVSVAADQVDDEINNALRLIGEHMQVDRACVDQFSADKDSFHLTHVWEVESITTHPEQRVAVAGRLPWYTSQMLSGQPFVFSDLDELPAEAEAERQNNQNLGIQSSAIIPLMVGGDVIGAFGFNMIRQRREWTQSVVDHLVLFGQVIAHAIARQRHEQREAEHRRFERLISEISLPLINISLEDMDLHLTRSLQRIGEFLNVERVGLVKFCEGEGHVNPRYLWTAEGSRFDEFLQSVQFDQHFPVVTRFAMACEPLVVPNTQEFPENENATNERKYCQRLGIKSLLMIPVALQEGARLVLAVDAMRTQRSWQPELVDAMTVVLKVFANALLRAQHEQQLAAAYTEIEQLTKRLEAENVYLREEIRLKYNYEDIIGQSEGIRSALRQAEQVAPTDSTVLILGETGTGKELLARAIHSQSARQDRPLVSVNCAALPATLIESELFGREKGAFTGALTKQIGRFEIADGSTIFLDEIGELPLELQVKLLRVLETGELERLGTSTTVKVDVRVIAATNRDLQQAVRDGGFRQDLYFRLNVFPIAVPPLRQRAEDIPPMVWAFVREFCDCMGKSIDTIPRRMMDALVKYPWPGNVRELRNVIERAVIMSSDNVLRVVLPEDNAGQNLDLTLEEVERNHILHVLDQTAWRVKGTAGAAELLGLNPSTLKSRMQKLGIERPK